MSYVVIAPLVIARDETGQNHHVYQGGVIEWLSPEQEQHFLAEGLIKELSEDDVGEDGKPLRAATKPVLVEWLADHQSDYSRDQLGDMTKDELWVLIDAK